MPQGNQIIYNIPRKPTVGMSQNRFFTSREKYLWFHPSGNIKNIYNGPRQSFIGRLHSDFQYLPLIYLKEGTSEGGLTTVAEGATKPQIDFDLSEVIVPAEYIAGWLRISTKMLDDVPSMRAFLSNRLMQALLVVEDTQLMAGNGTPPNLKGINTSGNFTAATGTVTVPVERIIESIAQLAAMSRKPDGIILHPTDYFNLILNKADLSGEYDMPEIVTISENGVMRIGGAPVTWTIAQTEGTFTIGDFSQGSLLLFRDAPIIEFFAQDGTNVRENKITIRIEERVAFAVFASTYFVKGTIQAEE